MTKDNFILELEKIGITCDQNKLDKLDKYYDLLVEWNEKINLTAITDYDQVYLKHFYDSLTIAKAIDLNSVSTICDVGTGAGFPGLVIKIFYPHLKLTLIDSLNKRTVFLNEVVNQLELDNVEIIHTRCEEYAMKVRETYDVVTARAVANLSVLIEYCAPLVKVNGYFIPLKGKIDDEITAACNAEKELSLKKEDIINFTLPIENSERNIIRYLKVDKTKNKYPRKFSEIKKRPL